MASRSAPAGKKGPGSSAAPTVGVGQWMRQLGAFEVLEREEVADLAKRYAAGREAGRILSETSRELTALERVRLRRVVRFGERSRDRLIQHNLRLVPKFALKERWRGLDDESLLQYGNLGLMTAVDRYDHTLGYTFATYASWWIRQAAARGAAHDGRVVHVPMHVQDLSGKLIAAEARLARDGNHDPTLEQLAEAAGVTPERAASCRQAMTRVRSLDATMPSRSEGDLPSLGESLADEGPGPEHQAVTDERAREIAALLDGLEERDRQILRMRFGLEGNDPVSLVELSKLLELSYSRTCVLERQALLRVRRVATARIPAADRR
jgi:RNA polymerase sigma factor (sigma-70 family)